MSAQAAPHLAEVERPYADNAAYLADELDKLDALLRLRVAACRQESAGAPGAGGHPFFITDADIDRLLAHAAGPEDGSAAGTHAFVRTQQRRIDARVRASLAQGHFLGLPRLAHLFGLSGFEAQVLLICLAPELRRAYDQIYAYLQDDITRKRPSIDLVLDLLCETEAEAWEARSLFAPQAPLVRVGLVQRLDDPQSPSGSSGLSSFLRIDPRIVHFLLGHRVLDERLAPLVQLQRGEEGRLPTPPADAAALLDFARRNFGGAHAQPCVLHLSGPRGVGRASLAQAVCSALGLLLLRLDVRRLPREPAEAEACLRLALRESLLLQAPLYLAHAEGLLGEAASRLALARAVEEYGWLTFLGTEKPWRHPGLFGETLFYSTILSAPKRPARETAWRHTIAHELPGAEADALAPALAQHFELTPGRIREAVRTLQHRRLVLGEAQPLSFDALAAVCRAQASHDLQSLATKSEPRHGWDDLVLPEPRKAQLLEMCAHVRHQYQVYEQWGFGERLARGSGLSALFAGPSGTGKTLAADVLAHELQLDLYKVDLARIVSKYIGETEKNLGRIFDEAEHSHAILFFDEADALFGKRTEVSDAHDRYANIETSYLLQKMEEYRGLVILATNLRENMDDAFLRRLRFIVEFPFPDAAHRAQIWQTHFPPQAPRSEDIDLTVLAEYFDVAGGNIKNIVLHAAFLAAADGTSICMEHLWQSVRREYEKIGKLWDAQQFKQPEA